MNKFLKFSVALILFLAFGPTNAVNVYQCKDEEGNITFQDICPPGTTPVGEKKYGSSKEKAAGASDEGNTNTSAVIYLLPDCEGCELVKEMLGARNISITEIDLTDNLDAQAELREKTGDEEIKVPVTVIGDKTITGYDRKKLLAALSNSDSDETKPE